MLIAVPASTVLEIQDNEQALYDEEIELGTDAEIEWYGTAILTEVT